MAGASWRDLPGIPSQYTGMYGFLKTVWNLGQNFFACLPAVAAKEAFAVLEKPGGGGVPSGTSQPPGFIPWLLNYTVHPLVPMPRL